LIGPSIGKEFFENLVEKRKIKDHAKELQNLSKSFPGS